MVLNSDRHLDKAYELSGDTAWTFGEFAEEVIRQSGTTVVHTYVPPEEQKHPHRLRCSGSDRRHHRRGGRRHQRGKLAGTPGDLSRLIGRLTTPVADTIVAALASLRS